MRSVGLAALALLYAPRLLLLLAAQDVPRGGGGHDAAGPHLRSLQRLSLMPTYMMHLYRNFRANFSSQQPTDAAEQDAAMRRADTVRSVLAKGLTYRQRRWIATFDLRTLLPDKQIQAAELRMRFPRTQSVSNVTVEVYHRRRHACHMPRACKEQQLVGRLTGASLVSSSQSWSVFNMTSPLLRWLGKKSAARSRHRGVSRRRKGKKSKRGRPAPQQPPYGAWAQQDVSDRVLLVVFSHTGSDENSKAKASLLLTAEQSKFLSPADVKRARRPRRRRSKRGQREQTGRSQERGSDRFHCRRVDLHVDFNEIGWGSWIVFPKRYNAYRCEGSCPSPLGEELNPTNHAYMQSLVKYFHADRVAPPCCAPTRMSPLSMLYYESGQMLLRHHEDMVVDKCGCR